MASEILASRFFLKKKHTNESPYYDLTSEDKTCRFSQKSVQLELKLWSNSILLFSIDNCLTCML